MMLNPDQAENATLKGSVTGPGKDSLPKIFGKTIVLTEKKNIFSHGLAQLKNA